MYFVLKNKKVQKIGQYPSMIDVDIADQKKYNDILGEEKVKELIRAEGLKNYNVGIGSFVYLRRVFETIIERAREAASSKISDWDEASYTKAKVKEKIEMLADYLPTVLVENKETYSILSKGIHELEEEECKRLFGPLKKVIDLSLEEELYKSKQEKVKENLKQDIDRLSREL